MKNNYGAHRYAQQFFSPAGIHIPVSKGDKPLSAKEIEQILVGLRGQRVLFLMGLVQWGQAMKEFVYGA